MSELNAEQIGRLVHTVTEALIELGINAGERGENYPLQLDDLVPAIKKLKASNTAAHGELKMLEAVQEQMENNLKDQFDQMQVSLIAFVMHKCGRRTLAIDSREIMDTTKFGAMAITVSSVDAYTTRYNVTPRKDNKHV